MRILIGIAYLMSMQMIQAMEKLDSIVLKMRPKLSQTYEALKAIDAMDKDGLNKWNSPTKVDKDGNTQLHYAVLSESADVITKLSTIENVTASNKYGITPVVIALYAGNQAAISALLAINMQILSKPESEYNFSFPDWISITQAYKRIKNEGGEGFEERLIEELAIALTAGQNLK